MTKPVRIQLSRKKGWRMPSNTVKVDRTTKWGNPFPVQRATATRGGQPFETWVVGTWEGPAMWIRDSLTEAMSISVDAYRAWLLHPARSRLLDEARAKLRGKNLACWCGDGPCHADVLLEIANSDEDLPTPPATIGDGREVL